MKQKSIKTKVIAIVCVALLISMYVIYQFVLFSKAEMETQPALKETVYSTIDTKCFVVRDEEKLLNNATGTKVSFAANGERVANGDTVSVVFNSSDDAASYLKINELEKNIAHFEELSRQANFQAINIDSLNSKIENELIDYLECCDSKSYNNAIISVDSFRDSVTGKQIATGVDLDFSEQLANLKNELSALKSSDYSYTEIKSDSAGYYIDGSDGYEDTIDFDNIDKIDYKVVENSINAKPQPVSTNVVGRIVSSFKWYIVCNIPTEDTINLTQGESLQVNFSLEGIEGLPVTLYKIGERDGDKTMLILSCDVMNESLADLRIEDVQIVTKAYSGFKISNSAIRTVNGEKGVYVVRGNLLGFRKVHIVYSTDTYTIVDNPEGSTDYIKQYDEVVTKGVELYDNKLV